MARQIARTQRAKHVVLNKKQETVGMLASRDGFLFFIGKYEVFGERARRARQGGLRMPEADCKKIPVRSIKININKFKRVYFLR